jgi:hypothetical protein
MQAVLALPPAVGREEEEAEHVTEARVRGPRREHRVVREVMEERVHPDQEHRRHQAQRDREPRPRPDDRGDDPHAEIRHDHARYLAQAASPVDLQVPGEVALLDQSSER